MMNMKRVLSAVLVASMFMVGNVGCAEKPPAKNETRITTPVGRRSLSRDQRSLLAGILRP